MTNQGIFQYFFVAIAGLWVCTSLIISRKWFYDILGISLLGAIYITFMILYFVFDYGDLTLSRLVGPMFVFFYAFMGYFYSRLKEEKVIQFILFFVAVCFLTTALTTSSALLDYSNVSRLMTSSGTSQDIVARLERMNVGAFDFIYGTVILIPILVLSLKLSIERKSKILIITTLSVIGVAMLMIFLANFVTAYVLAITAIFLSFLSTKHRIYSTFFISIILVMAIFPIIMDIVIFILNFIKDASPSIRTHIRIEGLINFLHGDIQVNSLTIRTRLFMNSLNSFLSSPFVGVGAYYSTSYDLIGRHAQFIDDLGRFGILGAGPIFIFMFGLFKKHTTLIYNLRIRNSFVYSVLLFIILGFLNPIYSYGITLSIFFVLPILATYLQDRLIKKT
jgi:hypothetical protein